MPKYIAVICTDKAGPEAGAARKQHAKAHLDYIESVLDKIAVAGPLKRPDGSDWGSLLVYKTEDPDQARAWLSGDPYASAGIWESVEVQSFFGAAGDWVGGKAW